ncbi:hypothetical protein ABIB40_001583 [Pedobacter sp. UYP30]|uniref:ABC transporter ATPase n=1 Tax=Pedobacter sp. UYP30 TaxID=1756400 RepID=UPI003390FBF2
MLNLYMSFSPQSRVWIYQSDRQFTLSEEKVIAEKLAVFTKQWQAHGSELLASAEIMHGFFIVLIVDETQANVTGCSIDSSVRLIKEIEKELKVDLFNRLNIAYLDGDQVALVGRSEFEDLINQGKVNAETIVFNNLVQTLKELNNSWKVPFRNSWHTKVFNMVMPLA